MLSLLVFVGEAVRDAFDPRKALGAPARSAGLAGTAAADPATKAAAQ